MVLMAMGEDDTEDLVCSLAEVAEVRQDEVDAEMLVPREGEARVDDDEAAVGLDHRHVPCLHRRDRPAARCACLGLVTARILVDGFPGATAATGEPPAAP